MTRREVAMTMMAGAAGMASDGAEYGRGTLGKGIRSRFVEGVNGMKMHVLEAGFEGRGKPLVLLLHGFPELAYSWRKVLMPLAAQGYHVVAPDQRGYGRTTGWDGRYDGDVGSFRMLHLVKDAMALVRGLGYESVAAVVGHDFGSPVAAWCALLRPDVFRTVVLMSAPFGGAPALRGGGEGDIERELAALERPRKHYQWYYSTREADGNMRQAKQGLHAFLRAYYHVKSADWKENKPYALRAWAAAELAKMPTYYVMDLGLGMAETVAGEMPTAEAIAACRWLTEEELRVYSEEFGRTGFQGGLQWYRCGTGAYNAELAVFDGRTIDVPAYYLAGRSDWGVYQRPGALDRMRERVCTQFRGMELVEGAGHWVQQEQAGRVVELVLRFLAGERGRAKRG